MRQPRSASQRRDEQQATEEPAGAHALAPPAMLALQRSAGNAAVARMLARATKEEAREKHGIGALIEDFVNSETPREQGDSGMGPVDLAMEGLADWFTPADQPMKSVLLEHYAHGKGEFTLTLEQTQLMPTRIDLFSDAYSAAMAPFVKQVEQTHKPAIVSAKVRAQNNELGNFTVLVEGTLYPAEDAPKGVPPGRPHSLDGPAPAAGDGDMPMRFMGQMSWYDYWDFDSKLSQTLEGGSGRPLPAELAVTGVRLFVNGRPFDVRSPWVALAQDRGAPPLW